MKKALTIVFVTLGILFLAVVLVGIGFYISMHLGDESAEFNTQTLDATSSIHATTSNEVPTEVTTFVLSDSQKQALVNLGIDPSSVPSSITSEQEACFVGKLGQSRVSEIKSGATPSAIDFIKVKACL